MARQVVSSIRSLRTGAARSLDSDPSDACLVVRRRASPPLAPSQTNRVHALSSLHTGVHRAMSLQSALKVLNPVSSSPPARALPARRETWAGPCHAHAHACSLCLQEIGANGVMSAAEQASSSSILGSAISADAEALATLGEDDARRARALARHSVCGRVVCARVPQPHEPGVAQLCSCAQPAAPASSVRERTLLRVGVSAAVCGGPPASISDVAPLVPKVLYGTRFSVQSEVLMINTS